MNAQLLQQVRSELDLLDRFASTYGRRLGDLIEQLNSRPTPQLSDDCLRLCLEAVHMMLDVHKQLARNLGQAVDAPDCPPLRSAA